MTTILRLESKHRCGVFNTTNARSLSHDEELEALEIIHKCFDLMIKFNCGRNGDKHPGPYSDSLIANLIDSHAICIDDYFFGFADERAFRAWFYNDGLLAAMGEAGVTLACYRVSHRHDGRAHLTPSSVLRPNSPDTGSTSKATTVTPEPHSLTGTDSELAPSELDRDLP